VSVVWSGLTEFYKALDKVASDADLAAKEIVVTGAKWVTRAAQENFVGSHKRGTPTEAQPGEFPMIISGDLRRSIGADPVVREGFSEYATKVGPRMIYGRAVELGYMNQKGFPYFQPAVDRITPQLPGLAAEVWGRFLAK
jgi:hypothetical protein